MKTHSARRSLSFFLCLCMVISVITTSAVSASALSKDDALKKVDASRLDSFKIDKNQTVTAIISLNGDAQIDRELKGDSKKAARQASSRAASQQKALMSQMQESFDFDLCYTYSVLFNGIAVSTEFKNLSQIEKMDGVEGVYLSNEYTVPDYGKTPEATESGKLTGTDSMHMNGYNGEGTVIAVLDTGLRTTHEAFKDYGLSKNLALSKEKVESVNTVYRGKWLSNKIPFAYDYADKDTNVSDADYHGTHVAGIAVGYAEGSDGAVKFSGQAPAAQLLAMKVYHSEGKLVTDSSIYCAALEDAYLLGADVVNMSLGCPGGFTYDTGLEDSVFGNLYDKLEKAGIIVCIAAGNEHSMAYGNNCVIENTVPTEYTDYGTVGSPSTYPGTLSIASCGNSEYTANLLTVNGKKFAYTDNSESGTMFFDAFKGKTVKYVVIDGFGEEKDFENISNYVTPGEKWIAVIKRGKIIFQAKLNNAAAAGAVAMICYNDQEGDLDMQIDEYTVPGVSVTMDAGAAFVSAASGKVGSVKVLGKDIYPDNKKGKFMADSSNWGTTSDLQFKPQFTAPGVDINSAYAIGDREYKELDGTSMASPNAAGYFACVLQYLREEHNGISKVDAAKLAKKLTYSTADILDDYDGNIYSPRKQGAGLVNAVNLVNADAYVEEDPFTLLDDPQRTGKFEFEFTVTGASETTNTTYDIVSYVLTDRAEYNDEVVPKGWVNTLTSEELESKGYATVLTDEETITIKGTESKKVTVIISLTDAGKQYLNERFENGIYIEGFVVLEAKNSTSDIHTTFMGYYGDWLDCPIIDKLDMSAYVDYEYLINTTKMDDTDLTYAEAGYTVEDFLFGESYLGLNEAYLYSSEMYYDTYYNEFTEYGDVGYIGNNLFDYREYNPDAAALSSNGADCYHFADNLCIYPMTIRNAAHVIMVISNSETGEVYYVDDTPYVPKASLDSAIAGILGMAYKPTFYFWWDGKNTYDETSETYNQYVENDTKFTVDFYGWIDYDKETEKAFKDINGDYSQLLTSSWQSKNIWSFDAYIDTQAPVVESITYSYSLESIIVTVKDNRYLELVRTLDPKVEDTDNTLDYATPDTKKGESFKTALSIGGRKGDSFILEAIDYATNWPSQEIFVENKKLVIKDYKVNVYNEDGTVDESVTDTSIKLKKGDSTFDYGAGLPVGEYDVIIDGVDTGKNLVIEYFGKNSVDIGVGMQKVTLNVYNNVGEGYNPENVTFELRSDDLNATFEANRDKGMEGYYYANILPGTYELYANSKATGRTIEVKENSNDNCLFLIYYPLNYYTNTDEFIGEAPESEMHFTGEIITVPSNTYEYGDKEMLGWSLSKDGSTGILKAGETFEMPERAAMLYVIWEGQQVEPTETDTETDTDTERVPVDDKEYLGDVNCDGKINMQDVTSLQKVIAELNKHSDFGRTSEANADVNHDGKVNMQDVVTIQRYLAELITSF